jgi:hypothetical protein
VQPGAVTQRHLPVGVDGVVADPVVGVVEGHAAGQGFGAGVVGLLWGPSVQGPVRPDGVVVMGEGIELGLDPLDRRRRALMSEPALEALVEPLDLAAGPLSAFFCCVR